MREREWPPLYHSGAVRLLDIPFASFIAWETILRSAWSAWWRMFVEQIVRSVSCVTQMPLLEPSDAEAMAEVGVTRRWRVKEKSKWLFCSCYFSSIRDGLNEMHSVINWVPCGQWDVGKCPIMGSPEKTTTTKPICSVCRFLWCKWCHPYSSQATNTMSADAHSWKFDSFDQPVRAATTVPGTRSWALVRGQGSVKASFTLYSYFTLGSKKSSCEKLFLLIYAKPKVEGLPFVPHCPRHILLDFPKQWAINQSTLGCKRRWDKINP